MLLAHWDWPTVWITHCPMLTPSLSETHSIDCERDSLDSVTLRVKVTCETAQVTVTVDVIWDRDHRVSVWDTEQVPWVSQSHSSHTDCDCESDRLCGGCVTPADRAWDESKERQSQGHTDTYGQRTEGAWAVGDWLSEWVSENQNKIVNTLRVRVDTEIGHWLLS